MNVLVLNCGSSSVKYQFLDMKNEVLLCKGQVERVGMEDGMLSHQTHTGAKKRQALPVKSHAVAIKIILDTLVDEEYGAVRSLSEIHAVGHRVVHGAEEFAGSMLITDAVKAALERNIPLAPLHNPPNLLGIRAAEELLPGVPQCGVFDTAFHTTMPPHAFLYAIPYSMYKKHRIRRYGFHGTSHKYVSERAAEILGRPYGDLKIITAHLGNGSSITAIDGGKSVDTSMGYTPLEGLVMGTRCGDVDPALTYHMVVDLGMTVKEVNDLLNKQSGLKGMSGLSHDMRDIESAMAEGNEDARRAFEIFCYRLRKYIGAYAAAMDGLDVLVFTAGIGENSPAVRWAVCSKLGVLGIKVDKEKNESPVKEKIISTPDSRVVVMVIPTNEELAIARDTARIITEMRKAGG
ncbi:MAG: acetate kinase [Firmicutes bacterium]|jgi:acetate kinase|nr:acetate kinase [Bacillota bacterium]